MGYMGIIRINIFPESFRWRVLALLRGVVFSGLDTLATRCGLDFSLRKLGQNIKMCVSHDAVISKLARNEQTKVRHVSHDVQVFHGASCFMVFPYDFLYHVLQCFWS